MLESDRHRDRRSGAAGAEQHDASIDETDPLPPEGFHAAKPVEDISLPAAIAHACKRIDRTDDLRIRPDDVGKMERPRLVWNGEDESVEIRDFEQFRKAGIEVLGSDVNRHKHRVAPAAAKLRREHLRRTYLLDRIADNA